MSTPQEILQGMITDAPTQSALMTQSIAQIQLQINDLQEKQDAMKSGVGDVAKDRLESYLIGTKFTPSEDYHQVNGSKYNQIETSDGSLTDFKIYKKVTLTDLTFTTPTKFICRGNEAATFKKDDDLGFTLSGSKVYSTIKDDAIYTPTDPMHPFPVSDVTTVELNDSVLTSSLSQVWEFEYSYIAGDTNIDELISQWEFAHDYIIQPLGTSGTYGTQDHIAKLNDTKNVLTSNKSKIDSSVTVFSNYV